MESILFEVLDNINEGIIILDRHSKVAHINRYMVEILESEEELLDKSLYEILPGLDREFFKESLSKCYSKGYNFFFSNAIHKNIIISERSYNIRVKRVGEENNYYILVEFIDITNQTRRITQLKENTYELLKLNKKLEANEKKIENLAYYDSLTGLPNRLLFQKIATNAFRQAKSNDKTLAVIFIDIDRFKPINDKYGHRVGDEVLREVGIYIKKNLRGGDLVARFGGDEFLILLSECDSKEEYERVYSRLREDLRIIQLNQIPDKISLSMGISFYEQDGNTVGDLINIADLNMYESKKLNV